MKKALITLATVAMTAILVAGLTAQTGARRFVLDDFSRVARVADPQFSPDGKSIAVIISKPALEENRYAAAIYRVDITAENMQLLEPPTRTGVSFPRLVARWAADRLPRGGRHRQRIAPAGVRRLEQRRTGQANDHGADGGPAVRRAPDGKTIAFATADEPEMKTGWERYNNSFEVQINDNFLANAAQDSDPSLDRAVRRRAREPADVRDLDVADLPAAGRAVVLDHLGRPTARPSCSTARAALAARSRSPAAAPALARDAGRASSRR